MPEYYVTPQDLQDEEAADAFRTLFGEEELKRVLDTGDPEDSSSDAAGDGKRTWTQDEWEEAAGRTHEMDDDTFEDWDSAKREGRVTG